MKWGILKRWFKGLIRIELSFKLLKLLKIFKIYLIKKSMRRAALKQTQVREIYSNVVPKFTRPSSYSL